MGSHPKGARKFGPFEGFSWVESWRRAYFYISGCILVENQLSLSQFLIEIHRSRCDHPPHSHLIALAYLGTFSSLRESDMVDYSHH